MPDRRPITGIDVHGGLRIRFEGEAAAYSASGYTKVREDVEAYRDELRRRLEWVQHWLIQYRRQSGEQMERAQATGTSGGE